MAVLFHDKVVNLHKRKSRVLVTGGPLPFLVMGCFCAQALLPGALLAKFTADQLASGLAAFRDQARGAAAWAWDCSFARFGCVPATATPGYFHQKDGSTNKV